MLVSEPSDDAEGRNVLRRWTYISKSAISEERRESEMGQLTEAAIMRNTKLSISGALMHTGVHFAQVIEGDPEAVDELIKSISRDPRHFDIVDIQHCPVPERQFHGWMTFYDGSFAYFRSMLSQALAEPRSDAAIRLLRMFSELEAAGGIAS